MRSGGLMSRRGSLSVEAALSFPILLGFFILMLYATNMCIAYVSLNHAVDQSVKYLATNAYKYEKINQLNAEGLYAIDLAVEPNSIQYDYEEKAKLIVTNYLQKSKVDPNRCEITLFNVPGMKFAIDENDIIVQVTYSMPMNLPVFGNRDFTIVSTCVEKAWNKGWNREFRTTKEEGII